MLFHEIKEFADDAGLFDAREEKYITLPKEKSYSHRESEEKMRAEAEQINIKSKPVEIKTKKTQITMTYGESNAKNKQLYKETEELNQTHE